MCKIPRIIALLLALSIGRFAQAADEFEKPPINYSSSTPDNPVTRLQKDLEAGKAELKYEPKFGYLRAVLAALKIPQESQVLVFSKTSLQVHKISPTTPRAIYFNDDAYIGFCQDGDVLEVSVADQQLGTVFYTLEQSRGTAPRFTRQSDNCLICHGSSRTENVPGHLVRSLYVNMGGMPLLSAGSHLVTHTTPFEERWGGWYVTGRHGKQKHLGNLLIEGRDVPADLDISAGQNQTTLPERVNANRYLTPHSDLVALMVLEHQALVHNRLTKANFAARQALHYDQTMKKILGEPGQQHLDSTVRRIQGAGDELLEALLFTDEAKLTERVSGTSGFADSFAKQGKRDRHGRSLRDFDLTSRMFKYPCSYLIDSPSFEALPAELRDYVWQRLDKILSGEDTAKPWSHLTAADCTAIREILLETAAVPASWKH